MQGKGLRILVLTLNIYNGNNGKGLFRLLILAILTQWSVVYTNMSFLQEKISRQEFKINLITFLSLMINCIFLLFPSLYASVFKVCSATAWWDEIDRRCHLL